MQKGGKMLDITKINLNDVEVGFNKEGKYKYLIYFKNKVNDAFIFSISAKKILFILALKDKILKVIKDLYTFQQEEKQQKKTLTYKKEKTTKKKAIKEKAITLSDLAFESL